MDVTRAASLGLLIGACSLPRAPSPARPAPGSPALAQDAHEPKPWVEVLVEHALSVGTHQAGAMRATTVLTIDRGRATLVETGQDGPPGILTFEQADHATQWETTRRSSRAGTVRDAGDHLSLDFDSLELNCWRRSVVVAMPGAQRVLTPGRTPDPGDCHDPGVWSPTNTTRVDALVCSQGPAPEGGENDDVDEGAWWFAAAPGIEVVDVNEYCLQSRRLRLGK